MLSGNKMPLVSILLNCFNASNFIEKAIKSVIDQSYQNWELIIWDDGSTDDTLEICKKFKDNRIKIFTSTPNVGLSQSRIKASQKLNGNLIAILDSDDFYHPQKISKQVEIFTKNPNILICSTWAKFILETGKIVNLFENDEPINDIKKKLKFINLLPHSSIMYKKNAAKKVEWYSNDLEYSQDYDLTLKLIGHGDLYLIKEHLTYIVDQPMSMSNLKSLNFTKIMENIKILKNNLKGQNTDKEKEIIKTIIDILFLKLSLINLKKNFISSIKSIITILFKNPLIILKLNILKKIRKDKI